MFHHALKDRRESKGRKGFFFIFITFFRLPFLCALCHLERAGHSFGYDALGT